LDRIYPPEHRRLAEEIARSGVVVSDYALGTAPEGRNFPPRNRIISGLSLVAVIVEAGRTSGALITADFAVEQGREVFAVPGSIHRHASIGTNRLIESGARPLLEVADVLERLNMDVVARHESALPRLPEDQTERLILEALTSDPRHVDELSQACGLPISTLTASLAMLELKGHARQVGGMSYVRTREGHAEYRIE
jgi:DNA processing protein